MIFPALFFYLFAGVCIAAAVMVIAARNPVHSVLFLLLAFVNAAALFVLLGAVFLAMILIIVYVGPVSLLVAMIGATALRLLQQAHVNRQNSADQLALTKVTAIDLVKVRPRQGL